MNDLSEVDTFRCLRRLFTVQKGTAKRYRIEFNLTLEELSKLVTSPCGYCGGEGSNKLNYSGLVFWWTGLDRKDKKNGYVLDNIIPACKFCFGVRGRMDWMMWADFINSVSLTQKGEKPFDVPIHKERDKIDYFKRTNRQ